MAAGSASVQDLGSRPPARRTASRSPVRQRQVALGDGGLRDLGVGGDAVLGHQLRRRPIQVARVGHDRRWSHSYGVQESLHGLGVLLHEVALRATMQPMASAPSSRLASHSVAQGQGLAHAGVLHQQGGGGGDGQHAHAVLGGKPSWR